MPNAASKQTLEKNLSGTKSDSEGGTTLTDPLPGILGGGEYTIGGKSTSKDAAEAAKLIEKLRKTNPAEAAKLEKEQAGQATGIQSEENTVNESWEEKISKFFSDLTSANTWIRVLEVIGGGLLLLFGLWIVAKRELPKAVPV
jgi:hypothetical protein